jgi:uncharacterized protein (DUF2062 family)
MAGWLSRLREFVWPSMGPRRYLRYLGRRAQRLRATPHAIAAGIASGAAVSVFPFVGFHFILGFVLAFLTRGNMLAAAIGTAFGNPFTFPLFFAASYQIGRTILPGDQRHAERILANNDMTDLVARMFTEGLGGFWPVFEAMVVGAVPIALLTFAVFYILVRTFVVRSRLRRAMRFEARHLAAAEARPSGAAGEVREQAGSN